MIALLEYRHANGQSPYGQWFDALDRNAAARVVIALTRVEHGNFSNVKGVGAGVFECKIDFGPGYRVYFGKDGERIVILLGGGTKKRQSRDIGLARERWQDYKQRKRQEQ